MSELYVTYSARINKSMEKDIKTVMAKKSMTKSELVRTAIREYVERHKND